MPAWDARFEVPDVIGFSDYLAHRREFCREILGRVVQGAPGRLLTFPYPNTPAKIRRMTVLPAADLTIYRTAGGRLVRMTDSLLGDQVKSSRLIRQPPAWEFKHPKKAHQAFRREAIRLLREGHTPAMAQTDLMRYYESIDLVELELLLASCGCDLEAVAVVARMLTAWHSRDGLQGLPIGPEASAVLGNAFLLPVDQILRSAGTPHLRWMDDINLFGPDEAACEAALVPLDAALDRQRVRRSIEKTFIVSGEEAEARIQNGTLASLAVILSADHSRGNQEARAVFDEEVRGRPEAAPATFRFVIKTLGHDGDPYAAVALLEDPEVFNIDPRVGGDYVAETALDEDALAGQLFSAVEAPASERGDARRLHLIRAASNRSWGTDEGNLLMSIALNQSERPPVRAWAWRAARRTPAWDPREAEGFALTESDELVARAAVTTLRRGPDQIGLAGFVREVERTRPSLKFAARWAQMT